jgi:hypothetical protein
VKQGDRLTPLLFNAALEYYIRRLSADANSLLMYESGQTAGYANDINIVGRSQKRAEQIYRELEEHIKTIGLMINTMKKSYDPIKKRFKLQVNTISEY